MPWTKRLPSSVARHQRSCYGSQIVPTALGDLANAAFPGLFSCQPIFSTSRFMCPALSGRTSDSCERLLM